MELALIRDKSPPANGTYGKLHAEDFECETLERPWIPNPDGSPGGHPDTSCVPLGLYRLVLHDSPKHPQTFALVNEDLGVYETKEQIPEGATGRCEVLIHPANEVSELEGCIAPGRARLYGTPGVPKVMWSRLAFTDLKSRVPWTTGHTLSITEQA